MSSTPIKRRKTRAKVASHRERLRDRGLRPIQFWVPDVRTTRFAAEARKQCIAVAGGHGEDDDLAFIEAVFDWSDAR